MDLHAVILILVGSTFGLFLRLYIKYHFRRQIGFNIDHSLIANVLASLFLGIIVAINPTNKNLLFLLVVGFLGCLSTFSSFIYQLFNLIKNRQFLRLFFYYVSVLVLSFLFFCLGYFFILGLKS